MIEWWALVFAALIGAAVVDVTLFGWTVRALGFGQPFNGPARPASVSCSTARSPCISAWSRVDELLAVFRSAGYPVVA